MSLSGLDRVGNGCICWRSLYVISNFGEKVIGWSICWMEGMGDFLFIVIRNLENVVVCEGMWISFLRKLGK